MRRPLLKVPNFHFVASGVHPLEDLRFGPCELHRPEGDLVKDSGVKELHIGVLKDDAHATPKLPCKRFPGKRLFSQRLIAKNDAPPLWKTEAGEHSQQGRFARAVGAKHGNALPFLDGKRHAVESERFRITERNLGEFKYRGGLGHVWLDSSLEGNCRENDKPGQGPPVQGLHSKFIESVNRPPEAARQHGLIHVGSELHAFA